LYPDEEQSSAAQEGAATTHHELRYRLVDRLNKGIKKLPGVHRVLRFLADKLLPGKSQPAKSPAAIHDARAQSALKQDAPVSPVQEEPALAPISLDALPYPPVEMRKLIGTTEQMHFENSEGKLIFGYLDFQFGPAVYDRVFDFGCGCGRLARQLILQKPQPRRYVGIDLHPGLIRWCQRNLHPAATNFDFFYHDVFNLTFNPKPGSPGVAPFPVGDSEFSLVIAHSVFTHVTEEQAIFYLRECARIIDQNGFLYTSWFLFEKQEFPMMQEVCNALYVSYHDPTAAVIFDRQWLIDKAHEMGLRICAPLPPSVRGHQWTIIMTRRTDLPEPEFPVDNAPRGWVRPPLVDGAQKIGLE
jgi:SAM-dependent methyltransferase